MRRNGHCERADGHQRCLPDARHLEALHDYQLVTLHMRRNGQCERADGHQRRLSHARRLEALLDYQLLSIAHAQELTL